MHDVARRVSHRSDGHRPAGAAGPHGGVLALQRSAGNAATAALIALQRDDSSPAAAAPGPAPTVVITAQEQPAAGVTPGAGATPASPAPTGGAPAAGGDTPAPSAGGGPAPAPDSGAAPAAGADTAPASGGAPAPAAGGTQPPSQWQLQYAYQGQRQYFFGQPAQDSLAQQVAVQLNVQHHANGASGREDTYTLQGAFDPTTGDFQGAQLQFQEALVSATLGSLQFSAFANASAGVNATPGGPQLTAGVGVGGQAAYNINDNVQVFLQGSLGANATQGQGVSGGYAVSAGMTFNIPGS